MVFRAVVFDRCFFGRRVTQLAQVERPVDVDGVVLVDTATSSEPLRPPRLARLHSQLGEAAAHRVLAVSLLDDRGGALGSHVAAVLGTQLFQLPARHPPGTLFLLRAILQLLGFSRRGTLPPGRCS